MRIRVGIRDSGFAGRMTARESGRNPTSPATALDSRLRIPINDSLVPAPRQCARKGDCAFAVPLNARHPCVRLQLGATVDRRHCQIELRPFCTAREHDADWMKEGSTLLTGARLHAVRRLAKFFAIEPWT